jgi:hypothetical protein
LKVFFGSVQASSVSFDEASDPTHVRVSVPDALASGDLLVKVRNSDSQESAGMTFEVLSKFIRGDVNLDGLLDLSDPIRELLVLFLGETFSCREALDANDDGAVDVSDALRLLEYLFQDGAPPPAPYPSKGIDPTADSLGCGRGL